MKILGPNLTTSNGWMGLDGDEQGTKRIWRRVKFQFHQIISGLCLYSMQLET